MKPCCIDYLSNIKWDARKINNSYNGQKVKTNRQDVLTILKSAWFITKPMNHQKFTYKNIVEIFKICIFVL